MAITQKSIKILWAAAAGRCSFPDCWERLCPNEAEVTAPFTLGEMAHICGEEPGSNRHNVSQTPRERDDYANLILLCPTHHTLIDCKENEVIYTVDMLLKLKAEHEAKVLSRLDRDHNPSRTEIAQEILGLLEENRQSWNKYGPLSELAQKQPHNDAAHAVWVFERLSIIVPNNRRITKILSDNKVVFDAEIVASFLLHARSYEKWVHDDIPYAAVERFPIRFDALIREVSSAGTQ